MFKRFLISDYLRNKVNKVYLKEDEKKDDNGCFEFLWCFF